jgi:uncharacterized membrane protein YqaE (UPF0057 family)
MTNININIDSQSIGQLFNTIINRFSHLSSSEVILVIIALIVPPLPVFLRVGFTTHFWINIVLTILGYAPGVIHAMWVLLFM